MQLVVTFQPDCGVDERKAALWCAALDAQVIEFCAKHGLKYVPVNYYSTDVLLALDGAALTKFTTDSFMVTVQTTMDVPNALGYHDDVLGTIFARVLWQGDGTTITLSHEILELLGDETCDAWDAKGDGTEQAHEVCDRVEGDSYIENGEIDGDVLPVQVSNYLLPSAFVPHSVGPWDRMQRLKTWDGLTPDGYEIVRDRAGNVSDVFAARVVSGGSEQAHTTVRAKRSRADSRLSRRLAAHAKAVA